MPTDEKYEGWTNKPTWLVNLWIENDEPLYREKQRRTRAAARAGLKTGRTTYDFATEIQEWVEADLIPHLDGFASDLMSWALAHVNWEEIASSWLRDVA